MIITSVIVLALFRYCLTSHGQHMTYAYLLGDICCVFTSQLVTYLFGNKISVFVGVLAPVSLICMSAHKASVARCLFKPPSHIWTTYNPGIATVPFQKAHPKHALHYCDYQLPDHLYNSLRISNKRHMPTHLRAA